MSELEVVLVIASAVGSAVIAGVFFAFSTFVMTALGRLPASQGIAAMQHINITVINPWFLGVFLGTGAACAAAIVAVLADWDGSYGPLVLVGGALYLIGSVGLTSTYHQPRNLALERLDPDSTSSGSPWARYRAEWLAANHIRTIASAIASVLLIGALHVN
jgi:uncharacterized membrane protein